jgi:hypothetical protein
MIFSLLIKKERKSEFNHGEGKENKGRTEDRYL